MPRFKISADFICHDSRYRDTAEMEVVLDLPPSKKVAESLMHKLAEEMVRHREQLKDHETYPVDLLEVTITRVD